jgi:hypothetical protein
MGPRLGGSSALGAFLAGLPLGLSWAENAVARRLRLYVSVKLLLSTLYAVLAPLSYVNNKVTESVYEELRFPVISN